MKDTSNNYWSFKARIIPKGGKYDFHPKKERAEFLPPPTNPSTGLDLSYSVKKRQRNFSEVYNDS